MKFEIFGPKFGKWADKFKEFIESKEMDDIYAKLKADGGNEINIFPLPQDTFRVFREINPDNLKAIFFMQDPYFIKKLDKEGNVVPVATGVALDCSRHRDPQPSLEKFYEGIENELFNGLNLQYEAIPSLQYLSNQGIMMLNSDLTVVEDKPASHKGLWKKFMEYFLEEIIAAYHPGVPIVLAGKNSQELEKYANPLRNYIFKCEHPAYASRNNKVWDTNGVFGKVNKILKDDNNCRVMWLFEDVPF